MGEMEAMYRELGISSQVLAYGDKIEKELKSRFDEIDKTAEYNQLKVLHAMQKNKVSEACLYPSTGYGYNDMGRDTLEAVYADTFHTESALVRPLLACGTHALAVALAGNLRPGDELLSPVGKPYDTLEEVIGIRGGSLIIFIKNAVTDLYLPGMIDDFPIAVAEVKILSAVLCIYLVHHTGNTGIIHIYQKNSRSGVSSIGNLYHSAKRDHPVIPLGAIIKKILDMRGGKMHIFHLLHCLLIPALTGHIRVFFLRSHRLCCH